jgi:hypothetical protein
MVWSNERIIKWIEVIGLKEYANNLEESGVHGGVLVFDDSYDWLTLALALEIPIHDTVSRQILENEFNNLIATSTQRNFNVSFTEKVLTKSNNLKFILYLKFSGEDRQVTSQYFDF